MKEKLISVFVLLTLLSTTGLTQEDFNKAGRTAMQFLKIGIGARMAALGEAGIANMDDVNAVFWNPAAIASINNAEATFNYTRWFGDINFSAGAAGFRAGNFGVFAINYVAVDYGQIQEAFVTSQSGGLDSRTGNTFGGSDLAVGLAFSRNYTDKLSIGVNIKYVREELWEYSSDVVGFDVGTYYNTGWRGIRLAMSAQNFSRQARWLHTREEEQQNYELPLIFRIGWSVDLLGGQDLFLGGDPEQHRVSFNMDAIHTNDYAERVHMGGEYSFGNFLILRAGYRFNYDEGNVSFGAGLRPVISGIDMRIDYAYVNYEFLDSPHRFTMTLAF